jgi:membrane associated rhomboid family serine protease
MFFLFPVGVDYRTDRLPIVTFSLMGICTILYVIGVGLFLEQVGRVDTLNDPLIDKFGLIPNRATPLTWVSHLFLHAGFFHLLGNMVYLFLFGAVVEDMIGRAKFIAFFFIGGLAAAAIHIILSDPASADIPMVGASGAISACLGAVVILHPRTHVQFRYFFWVIIPFFFGDFTLPSWLVISFWFGKDIIGLVYETLNPSMQGGVAFGAHVGGMVAGLLICAGYRAIHGTRTSTDEA